jgi:hypothetical protein
MHPTMTHLIVKTPHLSETKEGTALSPPGKPLSALEREIVE